MKEATIVPSHMYLAVRRKDHKIVGMIDLRHHMNHPVRLNVLNAKALGISKLFVTCDEKNRGSEGVILANGGVYEKTIDVDGRGVKRYWISAA